MAKRIITGNELIFYIQLSVGYRSICHSKDTKLSTSADLLETTTKDNGKGKRYEYGGKTSTTLTVNALTNTIDDANFSEVQDIILQTRKLPFLFTDNNNIQWSGTVLLTTFDLDSPDNAVSSFNGTFVVDGDLVKAFDPDMPLPPAGSTVQILDQFGNILAIVDAPGTYSVVQFDTLDLRGWKNPDIIITSQDALSS